ncbi:MAG: ORF6N domain-containing protein [Paludibacter sp.]|nr:ORF6N domain-containing protein [Paludibacter sp.]
MTDIEVIQHKIYEIRGVRVMLDFDLSTLYGIETRALKQAVKRNINRFPDDFMFILTKIEANYLLTMGVSQNVIPLEYNFGGTLPMAFTEQGVAMLSGILRSQQAIDVNISIMRAFVQLRQFLLQNREIILSIDELRQRVKQLELSGEETLASINDLSEDTRREMDDIYIALTEMAKNKSESLKRNPIGFVKNKEK